MNYLITVGLPGSGKSTWAEKYQTDNRITRWCGDMNTVKIINCDNCANDNLKEYIKKEILVRSDIKEIIIDGLFTTNKDVNENDTYVKMLWTGEIDSKNKEAYVGDILQNKYGGCYIIRFGTIDISNQVCIKKYCTCFYKQHFNESFGLEPLNNTEYDEIIGNIYNDPELLQK